ncbi:MAG TPA: hypothetical protein DDW27_06360 [Bacteroidales bacterium]|nr:hypothetical protein [Bacteroidales bacterium]
MSYQAVIRNSSGALVTNHTVGMKISILQGSATGTVIYSETYSPGPQTNANGVLTIAVGSGTPVTGTFTGINWAAGPYFLKTETDLAGGSNYTIAGTTELLSVPYALHAKSTDNYAEADPVFGASPAKGITSGSITNWTSAYGWGNHATAGYVPDSRTITINGTAQNLISNRAWNVGTVTSIATDNGITGGPIATTGTVGLTGQALALHSLNINGLIVRTGSGTVTARTITAHSGIVSTNGDGVSGNPALGLTGQALAIHSLNSNGLIVRTGTAAFTGRSITQGSGIYVANPNGVSGNPEINLYGQALALHNLSTNGLITRIGTGTVAGRTITAGSGINVTNGNGVSGNPVIAARTWGIGDFAHGGIVFWVDATGQHGLVCAKNDQSTGIRWYAGTYTYTMAIMGQGPFSGEMNTAIIIANQGRGDGSTYAARICSQLQITEGGKTYGDWYLPSYEELDLMYINRATINTTAQANGGTAFSTGAYWSSRENSDSNAYAKNFTSGGQSNLTKNSTNRVRAVRTF